MRHLFFIPFVFAFTLIACSGDKKTDFQKYNDLKDQAIQSKHKTDTALLGFIFGMSDAQVTEHLNKLVTDSIIFIDPISNKYYYKMKTGQKTLSELMCSIIPRYGEDGLYKLTLLVKGNEDIMYSSELATLLIKGVVMEKYSSPDAQYDLGVGDETWVWFKNNMEISVFEHIEGPVLEYTDLTRENKVDESEESNLKKEKNKTKSQL